MRKRLLFFSICAFLFISFNLKAEEGPDPVPGVASPAAGEATASDPALKAALCEMAAWNATDKATRDSLLLAKAEFLAEVGESARAYETVCRIQRFGLSEDQRTELLRRKLIYSWDAGKLDDFQVLLEEAAASEPAEASALAQATATASTFSGKPRHRNIDAAMLLSIIPGAGLAYAGDWAAAGKYFLLQGGSIALGVGAYLSGLYVSAFLGGGMLLYTTLPPATAKAVEAAETFNREALREWYAPVVDALRTKKAVSAWHVNN